MATARITVHENGEYIAQILVAGRVVEVPVDEAYAFGPPDPEIDDEYIRWAEHAAPVTGDDEWGSR